MMTRRTHPAGCGSVDGEAQCDRCSVASMPRIPPNTLVTLSSMDGSADVLVRPPWWTK